MSNDFKALVDQAMKLNGRGHMRPVIEKEILHYDILFALNKAGLLDNLVFQGGTLLRMCHGSGRYSEDLDFAGGKDFNASNMRDFGNCIEAFIGERYGLGITVKPPKVLEVNAGERGVDVSKWQVSVITAPGQKDIPRQRIKIEVANIPAYTKVLRPVLKNYNFLPDGYSNLLINSESLDEVMADKLLSLVACESYIRYRDIWDLTWLKQKGAKVDSHLLNLKVEDYSVLNVHDKAERMVRSLPMIIASSGFNAQMTRFIPANIQQESLLKPGFADYLEHEVSEMLTEAYDLRPSDEPLFTM